MATLDAALSGDENDWIEALPDQATKNQITRLLATYGDPERAAIGWLFLTTSTERSGGESGEKQAKSFLERIKAEFVTYVCGRKYEKERRALTVVLEGGKYALVTSIAGAIAVHVLLPVPVVAPVVALLLIHVSKVGRNAYCQDSH
jgi:hypothetical protein